MILSSHKTYLYSSFELFVRPLTSRIGEQYMNSSINWKKMPIFIFNFFLHVLLLANFLILVEVITLSHKFIEFIDWEFKIISTSSQFYTISCSNFVLPYFL